MLSSADEPEGARGEDQQEAVDDRHPGHQRDGEDGRLERADRGAELGERRRRGR